MRSLEPVTLEIEVSNPTVRTVQGGITVSFSDPILVFDQSPGSRVYFPGSEIFRAGHEVTMRSRDVMVETWIGNWPSGESRTAWITFFPVRTGMLTVKTRAAWIRSLDARDVVSLPDRSTCRDQQDYPVRCRFVHVSESLPALAALREALGHRLASDPLTFESLQRLLLRPTDAQALAHFGIRLDARSRRVLETYAPLLRSRLREPDVRNHPRLLALIARLVQDPSDPEALEELGLLDDEVGATVDPHKARIAEIKSYLSEQQGGDNLLSLIAAEGDVHFGYSESSDLIVLGHEGRSYSFPRGPAVVARMIETLIRIKPESKYVHRKEEVSGYSYLEVLRILKKE